MKRIGVLVCFCFLAAATLHAQTTAEWLQQKKTRIKYLTQQVASLQVYLGSLQKGYRTVRSGLQLIDDLKEGDFDLHHDYFNSLLSVSPAILNTAKVQGIFALQKRVADISRETRTFLTSALLQPSEKAYLSSVIDNLLRKSADDVDNLGLITTSGKVSMNEKDRMQKINALYAGAADRYAFALHFKRSIQLLTAARLKDNHDGTTISALYGIK